MIRIAQSLVLAGIAVTAPVWAVSVPDDARASRRPNLPLLRASTWPPT